MIENRDDYYRIEKTRDRDDLAQHDDRGSIAPPLPNYTLSTVCPNCGSETYRHACKVRCDRCGFMWDCSEL